MIPTQFASIASHIWQSTLFAGAAVLLTWALRRNQARVRYAILLAASYKFLLPFSWLVSLGREFQWRTAPAALPHVVSTVTDVISAPTFLMPTAAAKPVPDHLALLPLIIWLVWGCGSLIVVAGWMREWLRIRVIVRAATRLPYALPIPVVSVPSRLEPGVFGIFRPVLLLPEDIAGKLSPAQLRVVLAHELCHVRRRDNLAAALHMLVEALFWFHPLVWRLDGRIVGERERACDEEVLRMGGAPAAYADTILAVCKSYVESPIACMSGITGSDLKKRVVNVMSNRLIENLGPGRKLLLSTLAIAAIVAPIVFGIINAPLLHAQATAAITGTQSSATLPTFDVASVKPDDPNDQIRGYRRLDAGGRIVYRAYTLRQLVMEAYGLRSYQLSGGPSWADGEMFNIEAEPPATSGAAKVKPADPKTAPPADELQMLRSLLQSRFQLVLSEEERDGTVYSLEPVASGIKRDQFHTPEHPDERPMVTTGRDEDLSQQGINYNLTGHNATMELLVERLEQQLSAPTKDNTGLTGNFDFVLHYTYDDSPASAKYPGIPRALQEQFGLRLQERKGPVDHYVISHAEQPTAN